MSLAKERDFWTDCAAHTAPYIFYDDTEYRLLMSLLGGESLRGRQVLEMGCGAGVWTTNLTRLGAEVYPFDLSSSIVLQVHRNVASALCHGFVADMHRLPFADACFDVAFGSMVIHHSQRHVELGQEVARVLKPDGLAVFHETSARNPLLMLARGTFVGRFGVPRHSSLGEYPLKPDDTQGFGRSFAWYKNHVGRMVLCQLGVKYLLRRETGPIFAVARWLDQLIYQTLPWFRSMSYYQILEFRVPL
jgi:ubiquinone/menaquinone biosynthesis C-methylase UbiE